MWNVRTMLNSGKLENIKMEMTRFDVDIQSVSEIRWSRYGDFWSKDVIYSGGEKQERTGVGAIKYNKWANEC